jgi:outer membrane protein TolC
MRKVAFLAYVLAVLAGPAAALPADPSVSAPPAAEVSAGVSPLDSLLREALAGNPEVAEARALWRAAAERTSHVGALEDPMLEFMLDEQPFEGGEGMWGVSLSQEIPFPGKRGPATDAARREADAAREMLLDAARRVVTDVKIAYYEHFQLESQVATMRESRAALADAVEATRARYETGVAGQQDLLLARVEGSALDGEILHAEALVGAARARINLLLARDASAPLGSTPVDSLSPFDARLEDLLAAAPSARPSLRAAEREAQAADAALSGARAAWRPDLLVGAGYLRMPDEVDAWRAEVGLTLPVWKGRKEDAMAREAERRHEAARSRLEAVRNRAGIEIEEQYAHVVSEREIVRLYEREILPQAELAYRSARANYLTGQVTFLTLLESLRKWIDLRKSYFEYLADSEMHLARLEEAAGQDLGGLRLDALIEAAAETKGESAP